MTNPQDTRLRETQQNGRVRPFPPGPLRCEARDALKGDGAQSAPAKRRSPERSAGLQEEDYGRGRVGGYD